MSAKPGQNPFLSAVSVTKSFGHTRANSNVSLQLNAGEIHALLGENGAGKSTLIAVLAGMLRPDSGRILVHDAEIHMHSPADALQAGIGVVFQRSSLVAELSIRENFRLHAHTSEQFVRRAHEVLARLSDRHLEPTQRVGSLDLGMRSLIEISRAIAARPRLLILDEPTALLDDAGVGRLFEVLTELRNSGVAVLLVTHKLSEVLAVADRATVMRNGSVVATFDEGEPFQTDAIVRAMFGSDALSQEHLESQQAAPAVASDELLRDSPPLLTLDAISTSSMAGECALSELSLELRAGEILGVAGITGNGQQHLAGVINGTITARGGSIRFRGREITKLSIRERIRGGIRSYTDDRFGAGLATQMSVAINLLLPRVGQRPFWRFFVTQRAPIESFAKAEIDAHGIHVTDVHERAGALSGGNAQKLLLARSFPGTARLAILQQPSHGLDLATVASVRSSIRDAASAGQAVMLISSDLDEVVALSDRVVVLESGRIVAELRGQSASTREQIVATMSGVRP